MLCGCAVTRLSFTSLHLPLTCQIFWGVGMDGFSWGGGNVGIWIVCEAVDREMLYQAQHTMGLFQP